MPNNRTPTLKKLPLFVQFLLKYVTKLIEFVELINPLRLFGPLRLLTFGDLSQPYAYLAPYSAVCLIEFGRLQYRRNLTNSSRHTGLLLSRLE